MKLITTLLPLAALSNAFVILNEELTNQMLVETQEASKSFPERVSDKTNTIYSQVEDLVGDFTENAFDSAMNAVQSTKDKFACYSAMTAFDGQGWLDSALTNIDDLDITDVKQTTHGHHGHHGHCHKPNRTVYELINESKYTTKLAELINDYPDLVEALNGTAANYTVFAPTDKALEKLSDHHEKPSKEVIKKTLAYHVSPEYYPAARVLVTHTIPTTFGEEHINGEPQRLRVGLGLNGLAVNFYSRIVAINIFGTNGVIHGVDHLIMPPPPVSKIISLLPAEFSTFELGLQKAGLWEKFSEEHHEGGTLFAPSNWAFKKLGPRINMFLFSSRGKKCLEALLKYHIVAGQTLYSDAYYSSHDGDKEDASGIPKGKYHIDLPTLLEDKSLSVDIARFGFFISMKINGFATVSTQDGIAQDGVVHELSSVLIPPKMPGGMMEEVSEDMSIEDLRDRLDGWAGEL